MNRRPQKDEYFLRIASLVSTRSTCLRRSVGCVLVNERGHVLATGYNGVAMGVPHCNEPLDRSSSINGTINVMLGADNEFPNACPAARAVSGSNLDGCEAIHAEQNALLQCKDVWDIYTCYVTNSPCLTCTKLLLNTSCRRIIFAARYAHDDEAQKLWQTSGAGKVWWEYRQAERVIRLPLPSD